MAKKKLIKLPLKPKNAKKIASRGGWKKTDRSELFVPTLWIYKCNIKSPHNGDWKVFFAREKQGDGTWGGTWAIDSHASLKRLREEVQVGHMMLAWQSDRPAAMGLCRVADLPSDGTDIDIVLQTLMIFPQPINLLGYKRTYQALDDGTGFQPGGGTLFPTTSTESEVIFELCGVPASLLRR